MPNGGNHGVHRGPDLKPRKRRSDVQRRRDWSRTPEYSSWVQMRSRCNNPDHPRWADWGGRGIAVCERWASFENFLADMGERPPGTTLERRNNDLGYDPGNCYWATPAQQNRNKRSTKVTIGAILEIEGLLDSGLSISAIASVVGIDRHYVGTIATTIEALRSAHP